MNMRCGPAAREKRRIFLRLLGLSMALAALMAIADSAMAGGCKEECCGTPTHCGHCGCAAPCKRMCKVVPDVKEVKKVVWQVKCEEFCTPYPGCPGHKCDGGCNEGCAAGCDVGCDAGCGKGCGRAIVAPECGPVRARKILVKKEITVQVPTFKCVPCYGCDSCCESGAVVPTPAAGGKTAPAPAPAAPKAPSAPKPAKQAFAPFPPALGIVSVN